MSLVVVLVRHAKSLHNDYVGNDLERHLNDRGYRDAADSAGWLLSKKKQVDLIISSPAIRAYSTALIFARRFSYPVDTIQLKSAVYEAGVRELLFVLAEIPTMTRSVMLFGHNPGFTDLTNYLCGPVCSHLPTAGIAVIELPQNKGEFYPKGAAKLLNLYSGHKSF